jgi:tRNA uridine 5-carboxymethylaminomethyl modification enzyme
LLLRHDNADRRLTPLGRRTGLVDDAAWQRLQAKEQAIAGALAYLRSHKHQRDTLEQWLRRTEMDWPQLVEMHPALRELQLSDDAVEQVVLETKYSGYIERQAAEVERFGKLEQRPIPASFDYAAIPQLRVEAREKLGRIRPANLGQASRISGITPADLAIILIYLQPNEADDAHGTPNCRQDRALS